MKIFLLKAKYFIKRNIYPITVSLCTALMIGIIALSAYTSIKSANEEMTIVSTQNPVKDEPSNKPENEDNKVEEKPSEDDEPSKETSSPETIIFDLPFENATVSKEYAEDKLLYDDTT